MNITVCQFDKVTIEESYESYTRYLYIWNHVEKKSLKERGVGLVEYLVRAVYDGKL